MSNTFASFGVTVAWDVIAFLGCLVSFNVLRRATFSKKIYAPKRYINESRYLRPKELPSTYFLGWIRPLTQYTEEDVIRTAGYDAAVYLRLLSFGVRLFLVLSIFNLLFILPVNLTGDRVDTLRKLASGDLSRNERIRLANEDPSATDEIETVIRNTEENETVSYKIGSFDKSSMTNIHPGSDRLWAHLISVWFITIFTIRLLWQYHQKAVDLRIRFLATAEKGAEAHTILVTDVPGLRYGSPLYRLMQSALFKFLPKKMRRRVEESIELLFSAATEGMIQMNNISSQVAKNISDQLQIKRPTLKSTKKSKGVSKETASNALRELSSEMQLLTYVDPATVTDMNPNEWVTKQLTNQIPLKDIVEKQFRDVYPNGLVKCANVIYDTTALEKLLKEYDNTTENLKDLMDHYSSKIRSHDYDVPARTKRLVPVFEGSWAVEAYGAKPLQIDLMEYYVKKLEFLKYRIQMEQSKTQEQVPAAFVTFHSRWAQTVASTAFHHHFPTTWNVRAAPHPNEIVWQNLKFRGWERMLRLAVVWIQFSALCLFFLVPVTIVQGLIQMDRLEKYPIIGSIVTFPLINGLLKAIVPNLALRIFLTILPAILRRFSTQQGLISLSEIDFEVVRKYFIFQTITVFSFSFIAGSILGQIQQLRDDPGSIRAVLGVAAPQSATFFISYVLYSGLFEGGLGFLNIPNLIKLWFFTKFAGTERAKERVWKNQTIEYGVEVPSHTLTILFGLAFSVINPLILPAVFIYFLAMKLMWTYNMLYIYSEEYQSGGKLWEHVFEQVIVGLVIMQSMMMGLFAIKRFPYSALLIPLPIVTLLFRSTAHRMYDKPLKILSLRAAHDLDIADQKEKCDDDDDDDLDKYKHPSFMIDWSELDTLLTEAIRLNEILTGLKGEFKKGGCLPVTK